MTRLGSMLLAAVFLSCAACDKPDINTDQVTSAASKSKELVDDAKDKAGERIDQLGDTAAKYDEELDAWLADPDKGSIEAYIVDKGGSAAELARIAKALHGTVDGETVVLPIYRPVGADEKDIDEAIGDMPRTEVVDGVTVGFKRLSHTDTTKQVKEEGYLVLWRREGHLIGFVYRKKSTIDLDAVAKEAPRLVAAVNKAL